MTKEAAEQRAAERTAAGVETRVVRSACVLGGYKTRNVSLRRASTARYDRSDKGRATRARYDRTDKRRAARARYNKTDKGRKRLSRYAVSALGSTGRRIRQRRQRMLREGNI